MSKNIFTSFDLSNLTLQNRFVMAPMTRNRSNQSGLVTPLMVQHYEQRASAGLIITESVPVSKQGVGYPMTPGIFNEEQMQSWKALVNAVHNKGSKIFIQLQHCGRISHPSFHSNNELPVAPSPLKPDGQAVTYLGMLDFVTPRALEENEIPQIVEQFKTAALHAKQAGFDGVEIHGANGYLIDQFLRDGTNQRTDKYGGNIENRMRLLNEVLKEVSTVWTSDRIGVRLTPENTFNSMSDSNPMEHFTYVLQKLSEKNLAYVHILEGDMMTKSSSMSYPKLRSHYSGIYIANNGYNLEKANRSIQSGDADLIAFGVPFLANPDLVRRFQENLPLNEFDYSTFYMGAEKGYIDYPFYDEEK